MNEYLLIGSPVAHSLSPVFQNAGFRALGLEARYVTRETSPRELNALAQDVRVGRVPGANITIPYKAEAAKLADRASLRVRVLGAANTWWRDAEGRLCAENTDVDGVRGALAIVSPARTSQAVILGAGGASAAASLACIGFFDRVVIVNRTRRRAETLALRLFERASEDRTVFGALAWQDGKGVGAAFEDADVVIHGTSIGIKGDAGMLDLLPWSRLSPLTKVLDLVYSTRETPMLARARAQGLQARDGLEMLLLQGIESQRLWLGRAPDAHAMRAALMKATGRGESQLQIPPAMPTANTNP